MIDLLFLVQPKYVKKNQVAWWSDIFCENSVFVISGKIMSDKYKPSSLFQ